MVLRRRPANGVALRAQLLSTGLATLLVASNFSRSVSGLFAFMALLSTAATLILYLSCALGGREAAAASDGSAGPWIVLPIVALASIYALWTLYGAGTGTDRLGRASADYRNPGLFAARRLSASDSFAATAVLAALYSAWAFYGAGIEANLWGLAMPAAAVPVYLIMRASIPARPARRRRPLQPRLRNQPAELPREAPAGIPRSCPAVPAI